MLCPVLNGSSRSMNGNGRSERRSFFSEWTRTRTDTLLGAKSSSSFCIIYSAQNAQQNEVISNHMYTLLPKLLQSNAQCRPQTVAKCISIYTCSCRGLFGKNYQTDCWKNDQMIGWTRTRTMAKFMNGNMN